MSSPFITIPRGFSYVAAATVSTSYLLFWQSKRVVRARRAAKIEYPQLYAEKSECETNEHAKKFNCVQRAHQNTLENMPMVLVNTLIMGLKFPVAAASICGLWTLTRVMYTLGYSTGDPQKRFAYGGTGALYTQVGLILGSTWAVVEFIYAGL
ncbi:hypothetical protein JAAARDRAFT_29357 [Jaapia argillacea MUCL 33604]|uniref:Glutathione transferase n=1 Tax=Jaapia argillacea MUCL 33604 TaxID=933084 RepID=A0A067QIJ0_9AGAM|nr:hypothetical protein JAAARDRAFT_29357 [Jaapia argillacea MUCL 33604]